MNELRTSDENDCALCHGAGRIGIPAQYVISAVALARGPNG
jgi:hypothetical protein